MTDETTERLALPSPRDLTSEEVRLVKCAEVGKWWRPPRIDETVPDMDPANSDNWHSGRTIRASVIRCLILEETWAGRQAPWKLTPRGLRLAGARIIGVLDFEGASIERNLWFLSCFFEKRVNFSESQTRTVSLSGSYLRNGFRAQRANIKGSLFLRNGFVATGQVILHDARIEGQFNCNKGSFSNAGRRAISADGITIGGDATLRFGFNAIGGVSFIGAKIAGQLDCAGGSFEDEDGTALDCNGSSVGADVFLRGSFSAIGPVNFVGARIEGQLDCSGGTFQCTKGVALDADGIFVGSSIFLNTGFSAKGEVNLTNATVKGNLDCSGATLDCSSGCALDLTLAQIGAGLFLQKLEPAENKKQGLMGRLILAQTACRTYSDDRTGWPDAGNLVLDGFTYERFHDCKPGWEERLRWLDLQDRDHLYVSFRPQPWMQAIKVLRAMGYDDDARELAVRRESARRRSNGITIGQKLWLSVLGATVGYGYKPWLALWWSLGLVIFGWIVFATAADIGFMAPHDGSIQAYLADAPDHKLPSDYTRFNAPIFALDNFLPIIELGQDNSWEASDSQTGHERRRQDTWWVEGVRLALGHGWTVTGKSDAATNARNGRILDGVASFEAQMFRLGIHRFVYWFDELAGWVLVSLFIAGMSGIMKRE